MRLWDYRIVPYLPRLQLVAEWRELNSVFKKQDNHILINYIYNYPKEYLLTYTNKVIKEMKKRNIKIKSYANYNNYFEGIVEKKDMVFKEHNIEYLTICYWNLREKYLRGQKGFSDEEWRKLDDFYQKNLTNKNKGGILKV